MAPDKPFQTYEQLVAKLRDEKKLTIPDEQHVIDLLKKHSYFSLVSGYKSLFKDSNGLYLPGTTIDDLLALFEFDDRLRDIFFHAVQIIEKHIKSLLSYSFVAEYGDDQSAYLTPCNYAVTDSFGHEIPRRSMEVKRLIITFHNIVTPPSDHTYIEHQWKKHNNVPLWVAIKAVTLGTTSKMYSLCPQRIQASVSKEFSYVQEHELVGMLDFLTRVRNVCAHNERLYDFRTGKNRAIQAMPVHSQLGISKQKNYYKKGQDDLFASMICFKYLLSDAEFKKTANEIQHELDILCQKTKKFQRNKILSYMGFPENWYDIIHL